MRLLCFLYTSKWELFVLFALTCAYLCLFMLICTYLCLVICATRKWKKLFFFIHASWSVHIKIKIIDLCLFVLICVSWFMIHLDKSCFVLFVLTCVLFCIFCACKAFFLKKNKKFKIGLITSIYYTTYVIFFFRL